MNLYFLRRKGDGCLLFLKGFSWETDLWGTLSNFALKPQNWEGKSVFNQKRIWQKRNLLCGRPPAFALYISWKYHVRNTLFLIFASCEPLFYSSRKKKRWKLPTIPTMYCFIPILIDWGWFLQCYIVSHNIQRAHVHVVQN